MDVDSMARADYRKGQAARMAERFARAMLSHAVLHDGMIYIPVEVVMSALFPKLFADPPLPEPTEARPLTIEKVFAMAERFVEGLALWNPDDAELLDDEGIEAPKGAQPKKLEELKKRARLVRLRGLRE
jgi:hypothetical protein